MGSRLKLASLLVIGTSGIALLGDGNAAEQAGRITRAGTVAPGAWELLIEGSAPRRLCLADMLPLVQVSHPGLSCGWLVVEDVPGKATVHYTCPGAGWGRTTLKVATPRSVDIETQGIAARQPFALEVRARWVGDCSSHSLARR